MTALLTANREALSKAVFDGLVGIGAVAVSTEHADMIADALLTSGAVVATNTLVTDEEVVEAVAHKDYDMHAHSGAGDFDDDWITQAEQTLAAFSAVLTDGIAS
jgi:type IV secretory pathway TrbL component